MTDDAVALLERATSGERRATGRLLTIVERGGVEADALAALAHRRTGRAHIVGITGAPGVGKSTIVGALAAHRSTDGSRVAVLAIDPSSPVSGGAILGDRIRMDDAVASARERVFIRSMATRGQLGGLSLAVPNALRVLDAVGFDLVIIETAGVGQIEIDVVRMADTTAVVLAPGWGDAIQANKAGVLEIADVFVVNKADRPGVHDVVRDIDQMLDLGHAGADGSWRPPIVPMVATEATGVGDLAAALAEHRAQLAATGELTARRARRLHGEVRTRVRSALDVMLDDAIAADPSLFDALVSGAVSPADAATLLLARSRGNAVE